MPRWTDDDARLVSRAITTASLCVNCIVRQTGVPRLRVQGIVAMLGETLRAERNVVVCDGCLLTREVFKLV